MTKAEREQKIEFVRRNLRNRKIDALLVTGPENRRYLSGFQASDAQLNESSGALLISKSKLLLLTDSRYELEAREEAPDFETVLVKQGLPRTLGNSVRRLGIRRVAVESQYLTLSSYDRLRKLAGVEFVPTRGIIEVLRATKSASEISKIQKSVDLGEKVLNEVIRNLRPGMTEKEVAWEIEEVAARYGGDGVSFQPIVASGPNAAKPHAVPTSRRILEGEPIVIDMGTRLEGYCSDMTRTIFLGDFTPKFKEIYSIVHEAQTTAISCLKDGIPSAEVDHAARQLIAKAGYGKQFGHALGHGVGLAVHEAPRLSPRSKDVLKKGMIVTVEPGIYISDWGGVRLENMALVEDHGCRVLNREATFYTF